MPNLKDMELKDIRLMANLSIEDMSEMLEIDEKLIQDLENGTVENHDYIEDKMKRDLQEQLYVAKIKYEDCFGEDKEKGFSCYLLSPSNLDEFEFSWFFPSKDGKISTNIVYHIGILVEHGWKVIFVD